MTVAITDIVVEVDGVEVLVYNDLVGLYHLLVPVCLLHVMIPHRHVQGLNMESLECLYTVLKHHRDRLVYLHQHSGQR